MRKHLFWLCIGLLCLGVGLGSAQQMRSGEAAIFLTNGEKVISKIIDISSARALLQLENGQEIPLSQIWMINFVNDNWNFPDERSRIEGGKHYVFLKDGRISSGLIRDFSSRLFVFELDNGEKIEIGRISRIYFAKRVPDELMPKVPTAQKGEFYSGPFRAVSPRGGQEVIYEKGWYDLEIEPNAPLKQWHWTSRKARCVIVNPHRNAQLLIRGGASRDVVGNQRVIFKINGLRLDEFIPGAAVFEKSYNISREMMGNGNEFYLTIAVDPTFIPARVFPRNNDERELGVQIAYIYFR